MTNENKDCVKQGGVRWSRPESINYWARAFDIHKEAEQQKQAKQLGINAFQKAAIKALVQTHDMEEK